MFQKRLLCGLLKSKHKLPSVDQGYKDDPTYAEIDGADDHTLAQPYPLTPPPVTPFKIPRMAPLDLGASRGLGSSIRLISSRSIRSVKSCETLTATPGSGEGDTLYCREGLTELSCSGEYYPAGGFRTKGEWVLDQTVQIPLWETIHNLTYRSLGHALCLCING